MIELTFVPLLDAQALGQVESLFGLVGGHAVKALVVDAHNDLLVADFGQLAGAPQKCPLLLAEGVDAPPLVKYILSPPLLLLFGGLINKQTGEAPRHGALLDIL